jgi:hypothetical protein
MLARVGELIVAIKNNPPPLPVDEIAEATQFLEWLVANNFTFLGVREYAMTGDERGYTVIPESGLGILRSPDVHVLRRGNELVSITPEIMEFLREPRPLIITKANVRSRVHRRVHMDYIGVKRFDDDGKLIGEFRIVGLFTSTAYTRQTRSIPYLRRKVDNLMRRSGFDPDSHSGKAFAAVLENYSRDELFQIDDDTLYEFTQAILQLEERPRVRVLARGRAAGGLQPARQPGDALRVLGMNHRHRAVPARDGEHIEDLTIVELEVVVRHVDLERRIAFGDQGRQFLVQDDFGGIADDQVEGVVDQRLAVRAAMIVGDRFAQRLPFRLRRERNHRRRSAAGGRARAGSEVVRHLHRFRHRLIEMAVAVDPAWENQLAAGIDLGLPGREALRQRDHGPADDADIAAHRVGCRDDGPTADDEVVIAARCRRTHGTSSNSLPQPLTPRGSTPASFSDFHTAVLTVS